jgi:ribonuclease HI
LCFETESYDQGASGASMSGQNEYACYTDGSCKAGDGAPGGWGFVIKRPGSAPLEAYGSARGTLAKVMEYRAVAEALLVLPALANAVVFSDNQSLVENLSKRLASWARSDFANVDPQIIDSVRGIEACIRSKKLAVRFQWLRAHNGNAGNERADELAARGAREAKAEVAARGRAPRR